MCLAVLHHLSSAPAHDVMLSLEWLTHAAAQRAAVLRHDAQLQMLAAGNSENRCCNRKGKLLQPTLQRHPCSHNPIALTKMCSFAASTLSRNCCFVMLELPGGAGRCASDMLTVPLASVGGGADSSSTVCCSRRSPASYAALSAASLSTLPLPLLLLLLLPLEMA